ncbi:beta 1-4 rhamnosyltransferase Cps2T [Paenibacillus guangzhouensis]|uniref:beta 1-4 rhamnosyltransferase Cps2T n=1 Tax=Paenibacillus guangzhouensis TaxID=1473112 RepID=UPI0012675E13|nr:DUF1972 domain-containing protein [Paenibacillus guangzhouensis]
MKKQHVFIIGSKGIPAKYGGFETFVDRLTERRQNQDIQYHVACLSDEGGEFQYQQARCFRIKVPSIGSARAVLYDILSLRACIQYIKKHQLYNSVIYILACRIGPFFYAYKKQLMAMGVQVYVNPDGHEWKRGKWNRWIKQYWKLSERLMVKHADLLVCDSKGIEQYIHKDYAQYHPTTTFIAYGADVERSDIANHDANLVQWMDRYQIWPNDYYLIIGRFVPENNYEFMIAEFMKSKSKKNLVIITNVEHNKFYEELRIKTNFEQDDRIKFVGTVYDQALLKKIRELAYGYIHGHEVGGTNPSLLEALASTKINLLLNVIFNREVGEDGAVYFTKEQGSLTTLVHHVERYTVDMVAQLEYLAKERIYNEYSWEKIVKKYESLFMQDDAVQLDQISSWEQNDTMALSESRQHDVTMTGLKSYKSI